MGNGDSMAKTTLQKGSAPSERARIGLMDDVRGFCVFCMIFYHGFLQAYDSFGQVWGLTAYEFFRPAQPWFAGAFILICGISSRLSHSNWQRGLKLFGVALAINLVTILLLPNIHVLGVEFTGVEIWFGILNLLSVSILLFAAGHKVFDWLPPAAGAYLFAVLYYVFRQFEFGKVGFPGQLEWNAPSSWFQQAWSFPFGIHTPTFYSADYFPLLPWFCLFMAGAYLGMYVVEGYVPNFAYKSRVRPFNWLGRHALLIYVVHVPAVWVVLELLSLVGVL